MEFLKLIKMENDRPMDYKSTKRLYIRAKKEFMKCFDFNFMFERYLFYPLDKLSFGLIKRKPKKLFSNNDIAQILLNRNLVNNLEEALQETEILIKKGIILYKNQPSRFMAPEYDGGVGATFNRYKDSNGNLK